MLVFFLISGRDWHNKKANPSSYPPHISLAVHNNMSVRKYHCARCLTFWYSFKWEKKWDYLFRKQNYASIWYICKDNKNKLIQILKFFPLL